MIAVFVIFILANVFNSVSTDDPEAYMSEDEMIRYWSYPLEVHNVTTADGYILDLIRIPFGRYSANSTCHRPAVLCVHGLGGGSAEWVVNPPESSPAFILADSGFDVFLLNQRGTTRGKRHVSLKPWDNKFWQFSLDEYAKYDAPAVIDKALELSGQSSLYWIGESQGTIVGFMTLAETPAYNNKVKALFQITPVGTAGYSRGLMRFVFLAYNVFKPLTDWYRQTLGSHEFAFQLPQLIRPLISLCEHIPILGPEVCSDAIFLTGGPSAKTFNASRLQVYLSHLPCGTSTWNFLHWGQLATRLRVEHMDHNPVENLRRYGQMTPPPYDYGKIDAPVYLLWSRNDWLGMEEDIKHFIVKDLKKGVLKEMIEMPEYNHLDFGVATDVADKVYTPIIKIVRRQVENMCER